MRQVLESDIQLDAEIGLKLIFAILIGFVIVEIILGARGYFRKGDGR